ncbi:MAG: site-specific integrase [Oscillospiraceae bacterium]
MEKTSRGIPKAKEVEPIKRVSDIKKIKEYLIATKRWRDYCIFTVGINVGLRASDLLSLRIGQVDRTDEVTVTEKKTGKSRAFVINQSAREAIDLYLSERNDTSPDGYLFASQKCSDKPLTVSSLHRSLKTLFRQLGLKGNFGTHTLRKTFGYHVYNNNIKENPGIVQVLQKMFGHSSEAMTLRYIGITKEVIADTYQELNL